MNAYPTPQDRILRAPPVRVAEDRTLPKFVYFPSIVGFFLENVRANRNVKVHSLEAALGISPGIWGKVALGKHPITFPFVIRASSLIGAQTVNLMNQVFAGVESARRQGVTTLSNRESTPNETAVDLLDMAYLLKGPKSNYIDMM